MNYIYRLYLSINFNVEFDFVVVLVCNFAHRYIFAENIYYIASFDIQM